MSTTPATDHAGTRVIHKDWPPLDLTVQNRWDHEGPIGDIVCALDSYGVKTAEPIPLPAQMFLVTDIAKIKRYAVSYHGGVWTGPESSTGSELSMAVVGRLTDRRWFSVVASNDYTGWGCQDFADIRVGPTEASVVRFGLDSESRADLGYPEAVAP